ncbi:hypothetical protein [Nonomuraea zeae]|uniref:Uncharacterized protein n=1 Tax=Nonomuraea zeae TaxID=1642303 RepID=A0A5S4FL93_9ACTN|nr:hypothetical protein [Nonomuraea zeae]TMR20991.1 hypothetical protein ETD85_51490 [Nonomuraea zeae]
MEETAKDRGDLLEEIVAHPELNTDMVLAAVRDHGHGAYDVLVKEFPSDAVIEEFTKAARSGFTSFGIGVHLAELTDKGRKRLG